LTRINLLTTGDIRSRQLEDNPYDWFLVIDRFLISFYEFYDNLFKFKQRSVVTNTILLLLEKSVTLPTVGRNKFTTQTRS